MYTVVIVDDSALFRREIILTMPWEDLDCTVVGFAEDGYPGYKMIKDLKPDIVITDVKMIQMDGIEMIGKLKEVGCESRFIVISAYDEFDYAVEALKMNADDYLLKPISDEGLVESIRKSISLIRTKQFSEIREFEEKTINDFYLKFHNNEAKLKASDTNIYIVNATKYIREMFANNITISKVADELEISESYLVKLFRSELGMTFIEYLTKYRMYLSLSKLSKMSSTVYSVAEEVGYSDYRYFTRLFRKTFGINPSDFKSKYK